MIPQLDSLIIKIPSEFYLNSRCRFQKESTVHFKICHLAYFKHIYPYQQQQQQNTFIKQNIYDLGWEVQAKQVNNMQNTNPETKHTGVDCGSIFDDAR